MRFGIETIHLLHGSDIAFDKFGGLFILTGPNNSGKTKFLQEAYLSLSGHGVSQGRILSRSALFKEGTHEELITRLKDFGVRNEFNWTFEGVNIGGNFEGFFQTTGLSGLERVLVSQLTTSQRLGLTNAPKTIDFRSEPKSHPLHHLHRDGRKRRQLLQWFKRAFGTEIAIDLLGSKVIPLHVGDGAEPRGSEQVTDDAYLERLRSLPRLDEQGDGMKSFVGMLLNILYGHHDIIFLDEPEAFLHPPQARLLGTFLGRERPGNVQIFVATHSADFIRGALESSDPHLRIARISRQNDIGRITELAKGEIERSWSDPVLRFSNVIDGLFHEKVVVCEADGDCRFYAAITEALRTPDNHPYLRDVMFVQAGGKGGIPKLVAALKALAVPVSAVVDFDVFRQAGQLDSIIAALGGNPAEYQGDISVIRENINKLGSQPNAQEIKREIAKLLSEVDDSASELPKQLAKRLIDAIKAPPGWTRAKTTGLGVLDPRSRSRAQTLLERLKSIGLFVVPTGEIESFEINQTGTKNEWVAAVLEAHHHDMANASSLSEARTFVSGFIARP